MEGIKLMFILTFMIVIGIVIGTIASWLLGFLLVDKETMREIESKYEDTDTTA